MITFFEKIMWKQQSSRKYERNHHKDIIKSFSFILCLLTIISFKVLDENNIILLWCWARDGITAPSIHSHTKELQKVKVFHAYELRARARAWARNKKVTYRGPQCTLVQIEKVSFRNYFWGFSSIKRHHMDKNAIFHCFLGFLGLF